ncbi:helix-turn-helix domain-containing protein [Candidatus Dojkabacteria bacterium]|nr:helix-turn-helix domain-containing protein [Candidatus Dojkabacteria bacterium]
MKKHKLGKKIKQYRNKAKLSQFELELEINASPGSISRIETGKINPTRRTLGKIAKALKLKPSQIANLLGLNILTPEELISAINRVSKCLDLNTTLQTAVDIMFDMYPNYNGGIIFLIDQNNPDKVYSKTVSNMPGMPKVLELFPQKVTELYATLSTDKENFVVKAITQQKNFQSFDFTDIIKGVLPINVASGVVKILGFKAGIVLPMKYNCKVIGATFFAKRIREEFSQEEQKVLSLLTDQLAITIRNAQIFEEITNDIEALKSKITNLIY